MFDSALRCGFYDSPIGRLLMAVTDDALVLLDFTDASPDAAIAGLPARFGVPADAATHPLLDLTAAELDAYFAGSLTHFTVPLAYPGSAFQVQVWGELLNIPYGRTCAYQDVADAIGIPTATRAVGMTNGQNRLPIVIPCHRVVNSGGKLGGYSGGLWRKRYLLDLESGQRGLGF